MKKHGVLNHRLAEVIARIGHTDALVIGDAGLPVPSSTERIDLAVSAGVPAFIEVVRAVASELEVERLVVARELVERNPELVAEIQALFPKAMVDVVPHTEFKRQTGSSVAVVRTGEFTPYANVILVGGVPF